MTHRIRWRDPVLPREVLAHVPKGYEAVVYRETAYPLMQQHVEDVGLPPARAEHFVTLWQASLERGMQPSGLLLLRQVDLPPLIGHSTVGTVARWSAFCARRRLWVRVPGRLNPSLPGDDRGRMRSYLVVRPAEAGWSGTSM